MQFGNIYKYPFYRYNENCRLDKQLINRKVGNVFVPLISEYKYKFIAINTCEDAFILGLLGIVDHNMILASQHYCICH